MATQRIRDTGKATNAIITLTKAGVPGKRHVVKSISASFDDLVTTQEIVVKSATTVIWNLYSAQVTHTFDAGLQCVTGEALTITLAAGGPNKVGYLNYTGLTEDA